VAADRSPKPLSDEVQVFLFHLMRELLTNIVRRARPNNVNIFINRTDPNIGLTIENDWEAETPLPAPDDSLFFSIGERLQYLGGSLEVELGPGQKTLMSLMVPLEEKPLKKHGQS
jgi:signal transduction histidine kinase